MALQISKHKENSRDWWEERYEKSGDSLLYGKEPSGFIEMAIEKLPKGAAVLDIGCGEGRNAVYLAKRGFKVKGIDFSKQAIERAQKLSAESGVEVEFKVQDLDFFLPDLMSVEAIFCIDFVPPKTLQKNLIRGLKSHGIFVAEAYLMKAAQDGKALEAFECVKPGELLSTYYSSDLQPLYYSEVEASPKAYLLGQKKKLI